MVAGIGKPASMRLAPLLRELLIMRCHPSPRTPGFCHVSPGSGTDIDVSSVGNAAEHGVTINYHAEDSSGLLGSDGR